VSQAPSFPAVLSRLTTGDEQAAAQVFHRFARRLVGLATRRLDPLIRCKAGPEDVVQSAFLSFFQRQRDGAFDLESWDDLWDILVVITLRKCCNQAERFRAARRDVRREVAGPPPAADSGADWQAFDREPTPVEAAQLAETAERLLGGFAERERRILELTLQGLAVAEVAARVGCSERKVFRVLERARSELKRLAADAAESAA
jgi:RNA polymerase sigma-70 factor (ECF subfamily)